MILWRSLLLLPLLLALACPARAQTGALRDKFEPAEPPQLLQVLPTWTGDLPAIRERHRVRALVVSGPTNFFIDSQGRTRGYMYDLCKIYEKELDHKRAKRELPLTLTFVPVFFDEILQDLVDGKGDFIAHTLTITPERLTKVAFTEPLITDVREVLVTRKEDRELSRMEDFAGRQIHVVKGSSQVAHLKTLNVIFARQNLPPVNIVEAAATQGAEHLLEVLAAGIVDNVICDDFVARLWIKVFPNLKIHEAFPLSAGNSIAWAVRKDNPQLLESLNRTIAKLKQDSAAFERRFASYYKDARKLSDPFRDKVKGPILEHFKTYATDYRFDWLQSLAQGFQESGLDNSARSPMGAVGIMQVLPSTGKDMGFKEVFSVNNNIHAGIKYMSQVRDRFDEPGMTRENRFLFSLAAYNAGPNRIQKLRERAAQEGLDPNIWFGNVERLALRTIGMETVTYVRNINNYYIAYRLSLESYRKNQEYLEAHRKELAPEQPAAAKPRKSKARQAKP